MQTSQPTRTVDSIVFTYGENDCQSYWETQHRGIYYVVFQLEGTKHWTIFALTRTTSKLLNGSIRGQDGQFKTDPLYSKQELTLEGWLEQLAKYLNDL